MPCRTADKRAQARCSNSRAESAASGKRGSVAEWSKALVLGTSPKGRGFESHRCQERFVEFQRSTFGFLTSVPAQHGVHGVVEPEIMAMY